ncbi:hypothetical protein ACFLQR_03710 [Verrucomicrobiota bacterium]
MKVGDVLDKRFEDHKTQIMLAEQHKWLKRGIYLAVAFACVIGFFLFRYIRHYKPEVEAPEERETTIVEGEDEISVVGDDGVYGVIKREK